MEGKCSAGCSYRRRWWLRLCSVVQCGFRRVLGSEWVVHHHRQLRCTIAADAARRRRGRGAHSTSAAPNRRHRCANVPYVQPSFFLPILTTSLSFLRGRDAEGGSAGITIIATTAAMVGYVSSKSNEKIKKRKSAKKFNKKIQERNASRQQ